MYQDDTQSLEAELEQWIDIARHGNMALLSFNGVDAKYRPVAHAKEIASKLLGALKNELIDGDALRRSMEFIALMQADNFTYEPLPGPTCIRLLDIRPGSNTSRIECNLNVIDLLEEPEYTALSYSWRSNSDVALRPNPDAKDGETSAQRSMKSTLAQSYEKVKMLQKVLKQQDAEPVSATESKNIDEPTGKRTIICNGKMMKVWPNLYEALVHFRQSSPGRYWVDQLCINQNDKIEKSRQIQMMHRIYASAQLVRVWLGPCSPFQEDDVCSLLESPLPSEKDFKPELHWACKHLISSTWFERLWVLQEIVVARHVLFQFGKHTFSPDILVRIVEWMGLKTDTSDDHERSESTLKPAHVSLPFRYENVTMIPDLLRKSNAYQVGKGFSIFDWLQMSAVRKATSVDDYVYAGLGMIRREDLQIDPDIVDNKIPPPLPPRPGTLGPHAVIHPVCNWWHELRADILSDSRELFINFAACLLSHRHGINMLSFSQHDPNSTFKDPVLSQLPSWVPAPRNLNSPKSLARFGSKYSGACVHFPNTARISPNGTELHLDTAQLDTVSKISGPLQYSLAQAFSIFKNEDHYLVPSIPALFGIIAHVLIAGNCDEAKLSIENELRSFLLCLVGEAENLETWISLLEEKVDSLLSKAHWEMTKECGRSAVQRSDRSQQDAIKKYKQTQEAINNRAEEFKRGVKTRGELLEMLRIQFGFPEVPWPGPNHKVTNEERRLRTEYMLQFMGVSPSRSLFITTRGMIGLGPSWVEEGDVVMLVKGGKVPYLFARFDDHLKRAVQRHEKSEDVLKEKKRKDPTTQHITDALKESENAKQRLQNQIGKKDAWWLVGEAYVDGVMNGEAAYRNEFKRIVVV